MAEALQSTIAPRVTSYPQPGALSAGNPNPASMEVKARAIKASPKRSEPPHPSSARLASPFSSLSTPQWAALSCSQTRHLRPSSKKSQHPEQSSDTYSQGWQDFQVYRVLTPKPKPLLPATCSSVRNGNTDFEVNAALTLTSLRVFSHL